MKKGLLSAIISFATATLLLVFNIVEIISNYNLPTYISSVAAAFIMGVSGKIILDILYKKQ